MRYIKKIFVFLLLSMFIISSCGLFKTEVLKKEIYRKPVERRRIKKIKKRKLTYEEIKNKWTIESKDRSGVKNPTKLTKIKFTLYSPELLAAYYKIYKKERGDLTEEELKKTTFFKYVVVAMDMETYKEKKYLDLDLWHFYLIDDLGNRYEPERIKSSPIREVSYEDERGSCFHKKAILYFPKRNPRTGRLIMNRKTKYLKVEAYGLLERISAFFRFK